MSYLDEFIATGEEVLNYCPGCKIRVDRLREREARCREIEDRGLRVFASNSADRETELLVEREAVYQAQLREAERLRNDALDELSSHQLSRHLW